MMEREKLAGLIAKLDAVKVGHCDWAGYLVHRSDPTQQQLEYDQHCPACVIKAVKAELSQLLSELDAPAAPPASDKPVSECEVCGGTITHKANCLNGNSPLRLATLGEIEYLSDCSPAHGPYPGQQIQSESSAASAAPASVPGEDAWLEEFVLSQGEGARDRMRTLLRAYRANLLTNAARTKENK